MKLSNLSNSRKLDDDEIEEMYQNMKKSYISEQELKF